MQPGYIYARIIFLEFVNGLSAKYLLLVLACVSHFFSKYNMSFYAAFGLETYFHFFYPVPVSLLTYHPICLAKKERTFLMVEFVH